MQNTLSKSAIRPFQLLESLEIPCGYERSFKLLENNILANRYLLGFDTTQVSRSQWPDICGQLNMPPALMRDFQAGLSGANLALLGFEAEAGGTALYKLYLEYWDQLQRKKRDKASFSEPHLLHLGFKWQIDRPQRHLITRYHCQPGLDTDAIRQRISSHYGGLPAPASLNPAMSILELASARISEPEFLYIEVSEAGNPRKSFDLNLYSAGLTIGDIARPVRQVAIDLGVNQDKMNQLMPAIKDKLFGHLSAGTGRDGKEYFTVYYEN